MIYIKLIRIFVFTRMKLLVAHTLIMPGCRLYISNKKINKNKTYDLNVKIKGHCLIQ